MNFILIALRRPCLPPRPTGPACAGSSATTRRGAQTLPCPSTGFAQTALSSAPHRVFQ